MALSKKASLEVFGIKINSDPITIDMCQTLEQTAEVYIHQIFYFTFWGEKNQACPAAIRAVLTSTEKWMGYILCSSRALGQKLKIGLPKIAPDDDDAATAVNNCYTAECSLNEITEAVLSWRYLWIKPLDKTVRGRARTERGNTRGGATKKREISCTLLYRNLHFLL